MAASGTALEAWSPRVLSALRIATALLFLEYALMKLFDLPDPPPFEMVPIYYAAGIVELVGGSLLLLGLFTRLAAFILSGEMAVAYFHSHAPHSFYPTVNEGESAILFCFICLYLAVAGGGAWSLDRALPRWSGTRKPSVLAVKPVIRAAKAR